MRVFVYEFITGGGLLGNDLPQPLIREATMMVDSLVRDLNAVRGVSVMVSQDPRVNLPNMNASWLIPKRGESAEELLSRGIKLSDAVWPIAPETGGVLEHLTQRILDADKVLLGSRPDAVRIAASKSQTARRLQTAGVPTVATYTSAVQIPNATTAFVVKPDDGAGCLDTLICSGSEAAKAFLASHADKNYVVQPWLEGEALSFCMICKSGRAALLAVNSQHIFLQDGRVSVDVLTVNARRDETGQLAHLAARIASALPGLWGYVGVDLIQQKDAAIVLEVNPRLTTSFCGLREALDLNVGKMVVELLKPGDLSLSKSPQGKPIELKLAMDYAG